MRSAKKGLAVLAALLMLTGCAAFGNKELPRPDLSKLRPKEQKQQESAKSAAEQPARSEAAAEAPVFQTEHLSENRTEGEEILVDGFCSLPIVSGSGYEAAAKAVAEWSEKQRQQFRETVDQYEEEARAALQDFQEEDDYYFSGYSTYLYTECARADQRIISFKGMASDYTGGTHGNYGYFGVTFDAQSGKELELEDILTDRQQFHDRSWKYFQENLDEEHKEEMGESGMETLGEDWNPGGNWYLTAAGITLVFNPYEIGPYSMGVLEFTLPYAVFAEEIDPEYQYLAGPGVGMLSSNVKTRPTGDADYDVELVAEAVDEYGTCRLGLRSGDSEEDLHEEAERISKAYLMNREDGRTYVIFSPDWASDDFVTFLYEMTDGKLRRVQDGLIGCCIAEGGVNTKEITLDTRLDVLGTHSSPTVYHMEEDGTLTRASEWYEIQSDSPWTILTIIKPLPVTIQGEAQQLPVGTRIRITGTDNKGTASFRVLDSDVEGEIYYTEGTGEDEFALMIDGVREFDYFESINYAG